MIKYLIPFILTGYFVGNAQTTITSPDSRIRVEITLRDNEKERKVVEGIGKWMKANSESIYSTRPWKIFGEGPAQTEEAQLNGPGFNEGKGKQFSHEDIRFTTKGEVLYATAMGWPENGKLVVKSLAKQSKHFAKEIQKIEWLPSKQSLSFEQNENGLTISLPEKPSDEFSYANVVKIIS